VTRSTQREAGRSTGTDAKRCLAPELAATAYYRGKGGVLFGADCLAILPGIRTACIDTVFADPPFNIGKRYGARTDDALRDDEYLAWCKRWLAECVRILRPGGSLFVYNLPKWNILLGAHLMGLGMEFRHWIAIEMSACLPISGRLHPSHYGLLYFAKGRPATFRKIRTPIAACRHCGKDVKDYGGHRGALNPLGLNLKDVWTDIAPVRHATYKSMASRPSNALSTKILERVVEMSTHAGDIVVDPFGGSGTTYAVCAAKGRQWIGAEIDYAAVIVDRLENQTVRAHANSDIIDDAAQGRAVAPRPAARSAAATKAAAAARTRPRSGSGR
jgi:site-specific DNA-methyltransferase (adenine-specific)